MTELERRLEGAIPPADARWTPGRAEAVLAGIPARRRRRFAARTALASAGAMAAVVAVAIGLHGRAAPPGAKESASIRFDDGSVATLLDAHSVVRTAELAGDRTVVALDRGRVRFEVTRRPSRVFQVEAGPVAVSVLGTVFTVSRTGGRVAVSVERGAVRVSWAGGSEDLAAGASGEFPPQLGAVRPAGAATSSGAVGAETAESAAPDFVIDRTPDLSATSRAPSSPDVRSAEPASAAADWRALAGEGNLAAAYRALSLTGFVSIGDDPDDLLLAADVARLTRHPRDAIAPLRRMLDVHPSDPRAQLAGFTLGRVELDQLGSPREAAAAFERARSLDPAGSLAEDALAREIEAWSNAGEAVRAREAAIEYVRAYPNGRRLAAVRAYGGLQ